MTLTLLSLKEAFQQPFAPETIQFLPKEIHQEQGQYVCLALPYANKRVYEDRLNALVFGEWSSPSIPPYAQGNKLIVPATVVILGVAHMDYGEAFLTTNGKNGAREDENTATAAYSQAFRRACSKFLVGRYLYDLSKLKLPYDPKSKQIAVSNVERIAWVEKLYLERDLIKPRGASLHALTQSHTIVATKTALVQQQASSIAKESQSTMVPTSYPDDTFLDWVCLCVNRDPKRIEDINTTYKVAGLTHLSPPQREHLTKRLQRQISSQTVLPTQS